MRFFFRKDFSITGLVKLYGKHPIYTDSAVFYIEVRRSLSLVHRTYEFGDWFFEVIEKKYKRIELKTSIITFLVVRKFADLIMFGLTCFTYLTKRK